MLALTGDAIIAAGAVIGAAMITGPILWAMKRVDKRNTEQHAAAEVQRILNSRELETIKLHVVGMRADVTETRDAVNDHITWHAHS